MANTVEIVVKGTDQSGRALRSAADETKRVGEHAKGASAGLKLIGVAAAGLAAGGLVKFLKDSVAEARESQKVNAQTAAVLKSTGNAAHTSADEIGRLSMAISNKTGIDDEQIQSSANMLLTFTNVRNEVGKGNDIFNQATQTVTDMSVALGEDGKNAAIQLGKALNDPIKGITALSRVGVTFTDEQKKTIATMMKHNDILGAQKIILGELSKEFGGSAAAQATAGEKMKTIWKNFEEDVGTKLLPLLDKMETWFATKVVPVLENQVIPAIMATATWVTGTLVPAIRDQLGPVVAAAGDWLKNTLVPALQSVGTWIAGHQTLVATFAVGIGTMMAAFKTYKIIEATALAIRGLTMAMTANPILAVAVAILAIGTAFYFAYKRSQEFRDNVGDAISDVKIWLAEAGQWAINYLEIPILDAFSAIVHAAAAAFGWIPGIGSKLRQSRDQFDQWRRDADRNLHGLKATINTEQAAMKARDLKRQIDNIKQGRVPGIRANTEQARAAIADLQYRIAILQGKRLDIYVVTTQVQRTVFERINTSMPLNASGGVWRGKGYDTGGAYGQIGSINERGPELIKLPNGSMVYPAGQSKGMWDNATKGGGKVTLEINSGGSKLDDLLVELLRKAVRTRGGNVQLVLGR